MKSSHPSQLSDVCVVMRSAGERTTDLCKKLVLEQGIPSQNILHITEVPFSAAMRKGFELALDSGCKWTYCIDADVLLSPGSIKSMISLADDLDENVCEIQGKVFDKFFGGPRPAGNHFYRTSLLPEVIKRIPCEGVNVRPEYHTLQAMKSDGYLWFDVDVNVGLHDFEQYYKDIYRKCFVQAHKHINLSDMFVSLWRKHAADDSDMLVALLGFAGGIKHIEDVRIDVQAPYYLASIDEYRLTEKSEIILEDWNGHQVKTIIDSWNISDYFLRYFPILNTSTQSSNPHLASRLKRRLKMRGILLGTVYFGASILNRFALFLLKLSG